jgi:hypothetical protein
VVVPFCIQSRICVATLFLSAFQAFSASAQTSGLEPTELPVAELKAIYLTCERYAIAGDLASDGIGPCSIVYEELKRRAFDGDFGQLRQWFDEQKRAAGRIT